MHGLQLSLWVAVIIHKVWTELQMLFTVWVSLLWRAWSLNFWVRWMPLFHLVLKNSQLLFRTRVMKKNKNVIVPYLANLFHVALSEKRIPACWKKAKISPLYKTGSKLDTNNYRMLAVSGTLYRLYANILREMVTKWCVENRKVPDTRTQFSFYPDLNTILSMFILRHLVHAAKQIKPKGCSHLHTAFFNDSKQAYDTIIRPHLWDH